MTPKSAISLVCGAALLMLAGPAIAKDPSPKNREMAVIHS